MFRLPRFSVTRRCPSLLLRRPQRVKFPIPFNPTSLEFLFCSSVLREEPDNFTVQTWLENANRFSQFKDSESFHKLLQDTLDHARSGNNEAQLALGTFSFSNIFGVSHLMKFSLFLQWFSRNF
eukprot:TRINITY_DN219_c0_g1_i15.p1 TRINITY_DN219_c0_g1~~TRINITY_DN219_c0_g1_i15.p1  ORF type:complete len:123 (+),score=1.19 TRINITY_DN219_c0_g1_i15:92-460(+)